LAHARTEKSTYGIHDQCFPYGWSFQFSHNPCVCDVCSRAATTELGSRLSEAEAQKLNPFEQKKGLLKKQPFFLIPYSIECLH
jgi:hypothetical protein